MVYAASSNFSEASAGYKKIMSSDRGQALPKELSAGASVKLAPVKLLLHTINFVRECLGEKNTKLFKINHWHWPKTGTCGTLLHESVRGVREKCHVVSVPKKISFIFSYHNILFVFLHPFLFNIQFTFIFSQWTSCFLWM